ncbi:hypothetical protein QBC34DRAFT_452626 [Podospora aff. communis PSN243]|uniref:Uncharacterized protein n=1 Tax=Podospora aff. communis PSN243 TaxID=3040156 RepID=A0AAV9G343_9PEZI|nr:hypothetical protein QBC34DRAFT_452626 [Podospora aff. communis PSN243]
MAILPFSCQTVRSVWQSALSSSRVLRGRIAELKLGPKARTLREPIGLWILTAILTIIFSLAAHHVLFLGNPKTGSIRLSATDTNYIVSVLSQFFATVAVRTLEACLDVLRWALAARHNGLSFGNFVQLSGATDLFVALIVMLTTKLWSSAGLIRLLLPVGSLFFGSILKFKADFEQYFLQTNDEVPVFAGPIPIDVRVLVPTSYVCLYFAAWIPSLLGNPKYAVIPNGPASCGPNCTSFFLPGGLEIARKVRPILNATILEGGVFNDAEAIRVKNAPGFQLRFDSLEKFPFDPELDCSYYGEVVNDTIQICSADRKGDFNHTVLLSVTRRNATTTYSRRDLRIRKVIFNSDTAESVALNRTLLIWLLRLYADVFPDDRFTPLTHLQNFLAIPVQFSTVWSQFANYTVQDNPLASGLLAMSPDMLTTAESGREADRLRRHCPEEQGSPRWIYWLW